MWSIALLFSLAAAHPHHGFSHPGGKKGETSATDGGNGQCTGQTACNPDGSPCANGEFCNFDEVPSCEKCSQFHAPAACTTMVYETVASRQVFLERPQDRDAVAQRARVVVLPV